MGAQGLDVSSLQPFEYLERLGVEEIRLLQIHDKQDAGGVQVSLVAVSLDHAPSFVALSYTWGDPKSTAPILCDGRRLKVTTNLESALRQIRARQSLDAKDATTSAGDDPGQAIKAIPYIWIDAICINQTDMTEKAQQIQIMRRVYSIANRVIIWLGPEQPNDAMAFAQLSKLNDWGHGAIMMPYLYTLAMMMTMDGSTDLSDDDRAQIMASDPFHPVWDAIESLFQRAWFSRAWIIQEFACATQIEFWVGARVIDDLSLLTLPITVDMTASMRNLRTGNSISAYYNPFDNASKLISLKERFQAGELYGLYDALSETYGFNATVPHDRIFAVAGLVTPESINLDQLIDYSVSYNTLLSSIARDMLYTNEPGFDILSHVINSHNRPAQLPSWVPEWKFKGTPYTPLCVAFRDLEKDSEYLRVDETNILHIRGLIVDHIKTLIPPPHTSLMYARNKPATIYQWMTKLQSTVCSLARQQPGHSHLMDLQKALVCEHISSGSEGFHPASSGDLDLFTKWLENLRTISYPYGRLAHVLLDAPIVSNFLVYLRSKVSTVFMLSQLHAFWRKLHLITSTEDVYVQRLLKVFYYLAIVFVGVPFLIIFKSIQRFGKTRMGPPTKKLLIQVWQLIYDQCPIMLTNPLQPYMSRYELAIDPYNTSFNIWSTGRVFCITEKGRFGWVQDSATIGNSILVSRGSRIPLALRSVAENEWELVGDVYLAGLMNREIFTEGVIMEMEVRIR